MQSRVPKDASSAAVYENSTCKAGSPCVHSKGHRSCASVLSSLLARLNYLLFQDHHLTTHPL